MAIEGLNENRKEHSLAARDKAWPKFCFRRMVRNVIRALERVSNDSTVSACAQRVRTCRRNFLATSQFTGARSKSRGLSTH